MTTKKTIFNFEPSTLTQLKNHLTKVANRDNQILVGTFVETAYLKNDNILASNVIDYYNSTTDKRSVTLGLELKPLPSQIDSLKVWDKALLDSGMGFFEEGQLNTPDQSSTLTMDVLQPHSGMSNIQNMNVTLTMAEPKVNRATIKLKGQAYTYYKVKDTHVDSNDIETSHTVHLVFKNKQMDLEGIFSSLVGDLTKLETMKALSFFSDTNVTGMEIARSLYITDSVFVSMYAIDAPIKIFMDITDREVPLLITNDVSSVEVETVKIKGSQLIFLDSNKYEWRIKTSMGTVILALA